jgi:cell wall-associated NlpC family hydrolase
MFGTPYAWGGGGIGVRASRGTGKGTENVIGVDCSGLTSYVYGLFGINLPRYSGNQTVYGVRTNIANAKPGDLVGWARGGHVAIYAGNGYIIHSPQPGKTVTMRKLFNGEKVYGVSLRLPGD